jgi:uncharacterized Fe-S cluster-containing MiaB family protein
MINDNSKEELAFTGTKNTGPLEKLVEVNPNEELLNIFSGAYEKFNKEEKKLFMTGSDADKLEFIKKWEAQQRILEYISESSMIGAATGKPITI